MNKSDNLSPEQKRIRNNWRLIYVLAAVVGLMGGLAYASVPLYQIFCKVTGFGGTTQRVVEAPAPQQVKAREVTVRFNADVDSHLPWNFVPDVQTVKLKLGEVALVKYHATNRGSKTLVGMATYNVQPDRVGQFFNKIQCFCFTEQVLKPGETAEMPVQFFVDPALADDPKYADISEITLSYTFFLAKDQSKTVSTKPLKLTNK